MSHPRVPSRRLHRPSRLPRAALLLAAGLAAVLLAGAHDGPAATAQEPAHPARACPGLESLVPDTVIINALAHPNDTMAYGALCNPHAPPSIWNGRRTWLGLRDMGRPYDPIFNSVQWRCGCR